MNTGRQSLKDKLNQYSFIHRVDIDQREKKNSNDETQHYECESHIFIDDAIESNESGSKPNRFVKCFIELIDTAAT